MIFLCSVTIASIVDTPLLKIKGAGEGVNPGTSQQVGYVLYTSRTRTQEELFLVKPLRLDNIKPTSRDCLTFMRRIGRNQRTDPVDRNRQGTAHLHLSVARVI